MNTFKLENEQLDLLIYAHNPKGPALQGKSAGPLLSLIRFTDYG